MFSQLACKGAIRCFHLSPCSHTAWPTFLEFHFGARRLGCRTPLLTFLKPLHGFRSFLFPALSHIDPAQEIIRLAEIRIDSDRLAQGFPGLGIAAQLV